MALTFIDAANKLREAAGDAIDANRMADAFALLELAFTSAFMDKSKTPISFKLCQRENLPRPLASVEHVIVHVSRLGIIFYALVDIIGNPLCEFLRFPMVGEFFSNIAKKMPENGVFECIIDLGDGSDVGDYRRIAYSSSRAETILVPDPYFYMHDNYDAHRASVAGQAKPWRDRADVVFWRGTAGGRRSRDPDPEDQPRWDWLPRLRLCAASRESAYADMLDIALTSHHQIAEPYWRDAIEGAGFLRPAVPKRQFLDYKYLVDIDGWTNSWSLLDKIICGAAILKVESAQGYRQWYYDKLIPWENYVPLASDVSDLDEKIAWVLSHPAECERIAANAASLAEQIQLRPALAEAESAAMAILTPV